jgi:hypothetical protein
MLFTTLCNIAKRSQEGLSNFTMDGKRKTPADEYYQSGYYFEKKSA